MYNICIICILIRSLRARVSGQINFHIWSDQKPVYPHLKSLLHITFYLCWYYLCFISPILSLSDQIPAVTRFDCGRGSRCKEGLRCSDPRHNFFFMLLRFSQLKKLFWCSSDFLNKKIILRCSDPQHNFFWCCSDFLNTKKLFWCSSNFLNKKIMLLRSSTYFFLCCSDFLDTKK